MTTSAIKSTTLGAILTLVLLPAWVETTYAADREPSPAEEGTTVKTAATDPGQAYREEVARCIGNLVNAEIDGKERRALHGSKAYVDVKFRDDGSFEMASVSSRGYSKLASTIHVKMRWKKLPSPAQFGLALKRVTLEVGLIPSGEMIIVQQM